MLRIPPLYLKSQGQSLRITDMDVPNQTSPSVVRTFYELNRVLDLPSYATNATVFLNGWHLQYLHGDERVSGLGTVIGNIRVEAQALTWQTGAVLSDEDFDNAYSWCYYYTAIAWNRANIDLMVDQNDGIDLVDIANANWFYANNIASNPDGPIDASITSFPSFLENGKFVAKKTVAISPRGFAFNWKDCDDNDMFQLGYNLDHSEIFIENGKHYKKQREDVILTLPNDASQVDSRYVSWETAAILKDEDTRRDYGFGEIVTANAGNDVGVIQPPFSIQPIEAEGGIAGAEVGSEGVRTLEFVIEKVPFQHALPMLTGWNLAYFKRDAHVGQIGVWIEEMHYDKDPSAQTGTLHYTLSSVLHDDDTGRNFDSAHKVTVLGLRGVSGPAPD